MYSARKKGILVLLGTALAAIFIALAILFAPAFTRPAEAASDEQTADSVASIYKSGDHYYDSLQEAVDAAEGYAAGNVSPTIKLLKDVNLTESVTLDASAIKSGKYIKIDGQDHTLSASSVQQPLQIVGGADVADDVEVRISDLTMESTVAQANLLSVAGGNFSLVLDTVTLDTTGAGSNDRALSIGWNSTEPGTVGIEMTDCTLQASASGYAIMTYNPVELSIENSALTGYAALYMYNDNYGNGTGSAGSAVTIDGSTITANNPYATGSGSDFGAIVFKDKDIRVDIRNSDITVNATGTSHHGIVLFDTNTGSSIYTESTDVTLDGNSAHFIITTRGGSGTLQFGAGTRSNRAFDFENDDVLGSGFTSVADGDGYVVSATDPAATCGGIGCVSLQNAIDTAKEGQAATIVLQKDVAENVTIPANKEIVLDLNGHNVTAASGTAITNNGTLTVKDSTAAGDGEGYTAGTVSAASKAIYSTGPLTVEDGIFLGNYAVDTKCGPVVIHAGVFEGKSYPAVQFNKADGALQIEGGSFTSESTNYGAVYVYAADSVYIEDAAITGGTYGVYLKEGNEATICGETAISATNTSSKNLAALYALNVDMTIRDNVVADQLIRLGNGATVNIENGTYNAPLTNVATNGNASTGKFSITGGTFVSEDIVEWFDPSWLVDGSDIYALRSTGVAGQYIVNAYNNDDTDMIYVGGYVAAVDGVNYTTLANALAAAEGKTLKLLTNADEPLTIGASMTLDLGAFHVRASGTALTVNSGVTLTIEGSGRVYGEIANNGTLVLRGGIYAADQIDIDWVAEDRAIAYDSVDGLYTVSDDIGVTLTRGDRAYNFTNLVTPFNAGIAESGDTFVLQKDIAGGIILGENRNGKEYTIDLNGHDINGAFILYAGTLNIVNNSEAKAVSTISNAQRIFQLLPAEGCVVKLTLGANIDLMAGTEGVFIQTPITNDDIGNLDELQPVAILHSSANILSESSFAIVGNGTGHGTEIVIDGGSVKTSGNAPAIYHPQYGVLTVKGGAVIEGVTGIEIRNGILNVEDATIRSTADSFVAGATPSGGGSTVTGAAIAVTKYNNTLVPLQVNIGEATLQASANGVALYEGYPDADSGKVPAGNVVEMSVDGAVFEATVVSKNETNFIKSGTFSEGLPADYIAEDAVLYQQVDGSYTVADSETAAEDGVVVVMDGVGYASLEEAVAEGCKVIIEREGEAISEGFANITSSKIVDTAFIAALEAAEEGDVLRLVDDYKGVLSIDTLDRSITVDLNGHNWSASNGTAVVYVTTSADFTLINSGEEGGINANISAINIKAASGADVDVTIENVNVSSSRIASTLISLTGTDGTMRINLNGLDVDYTVTTKNQAMALSVTGADLTMSDSNISIAYGDSVTQGSATTTAIDLNHANAELTRVTATSEDGAGIVFTGSMSFDEAVAASVSEYAHLTLNGCTVSGSTIALSGNGGENLSGTLIDVQNSTLTSTGNAGLAVYHPQYGVLNILGTGNTLTGVTGIEIRAGELNVEGGTITATGAFASNPSGGGSTTDGVAIAVTQHTTALPIDVTISGGTLNATGAEGKSLYQANVQENDPTDVAKIEMQVTGGTFNAAVESENVTEFISGGTFGETLFEDYIADGSLQCPAEGGYIVGDPDIVAEGKDIFVIGNTAYDTLQSAVDAVPADNTQTTIKFVDGDGDKVIAGNGVVVKAGQNIVFDYNGNTYDIAGTTVGSSGTETNGFQLLKGSTVVMQNGTLTSGKAIILIQKYCDLTLDDMVLDGTQTKGYVLSNNNDTTTITGDTQIIAAEDGVAFDVYYWSKNGYDSVSVVFDENFTGSVAGRVEYTNDGTAVDNWYTNASLKINGNGTFDIELSVQDASGVEASAANINIAGGTFVNPVAGEYIADGFMIYQQEDGSYTVADDETAAEDGVVIVMNGVGYTSIDAAVEAGCVATIVGEQVDEGYETLEEALLAAEAGDTVTLQADITTAAMITIGKAVTLDLNGHDVIGGSTNSNFVMEITAGGVTVTNSVSAEEESIVQAGSAEIGALAIRSGLTEEVTIENITILIDDDRTSESGNIVGIQLQSPTLIDNVTIDISASYHLVLGILAADGEATISNSTFTVRGKEGSDAEVHAIHAQAGADIQLIDSAITATGNGTGVVFIGEYANGEEAISAGSSAFPTLTITDSTIVSDSFALAGNGASHGTVIEINNSTLTSELAAAIYHPQYGEMTIVNSNITGTSGIEVRAGIVTVTSGTITATGDPFASDPNGNGSTTDGAAVAVSQHTTNLPIRVTINGGTLLATGVDGKSLYEVDLYDEKVADIAISLMGGTFENAVESENVTGFIHGGQYKVLPAEELFAEGYTGELYNGYYIVVGEGTAAEDVGALLTARLEAQTDVRLYAAALGFRWADVQDDAEIASAYAAINAATSTSAVALAKAQAMDAIDAYCAAYEEELAEAREAALEKIEAAAGDDIAVPTSVYAAINGGASVEEIEAYAEAAVKEIEAIRSLRTEITAQAGELEGIAAAVEKLEGAFAGQGGEFDSLLGDIRAAISAAQEAIESGTSEALQDMQAALEAKIDAGTQAVKDAVSGVMEELTQLAESVAAGDKALQEAIAAGEKALAEQIEAVQGDIGALEGAVDGQASDLQASIDALESAVGEQASAVQADIDALRTAIAAAQADIDDILASIAAGGPSFEELAEQIAAIKSTADGVQTSVGDVQTAVKAAQDAVAAAQGALSGQIEEADDAASFTTLYVLVGIALALSAAAVALLVVLLLKRSKAA